MTSCKSPPTPRNQLFPSADVVLVEVVLREWSVDNNRFEPFGDNELRLHGVAADMSLGRRQQCAGVDLADDVPQVQIAVGNLFDFVAADFTEITLLAACHDNLLNL